MSRVFTSALGDVGYADLWEVAHVLSPAVDLMVSDVKARRSRAANMRVMREFFTNHAVHDHHGERCTHTHVWKRRIASKASFFFELSYTSHPQASAQEERSMRDVRGDEMVDEESDMLLTQAH